MQPPNYDKLKALIKSRKFWTLIVSIVTTLGAFATGEITVWQALIAGVGAASVYSVATGIEDGLSRLGLASARNAA